MTRELAPPQAESQVPPFLQTAQGVASPKWEKLKDALRRRVEAHKTLNAEYERLLQRFAPPTPASPATATRGPEYFKDVATAAVATFVAYDEQFRPVGEAPVGEGPERNRYHAGRRRTVRVFREIRQKGVEMMWCIRECASPRYDISVTITMAKKPGQPELTHAERVDAAKHILAVMKQSFPKFEEEGMTALFVRRAGSPRTGRGGVAAA